MLPTGFHRRLNRACCLTQNFNGGYVRIVSDRRFGTVYRGVLTLPTGLSVTIRCAFGTATIRIAPGTRNEIVVPRSLHRFTRVRNSTMIVNVAGELRV